MPKFLYKFVLLGPREQLNQLTAFLDGSVIYGSSSEQTSSLRTHKDGLLKSQVTYDGEELLTPSYDMEDSCNNVNESRYERYCFRSGLVSKKFFFFLNLNI